MKRNLVVHAQYDAQRRELEAFLQAFHTSGTYVAQGERNSIKKDTFSGEMLSIKKFKTPNVLQGLIYRFFRKSKAKRSFQYANKLISVGLHTPFPVAYMEKFKLGLAESFYVSRHLEYDLDFRVLNHNPRYPNREEILRQFAQFTFRLHENGIEFLDHSPGNTLIAHRGDGTYVFYLIDLNRMRFGEMDFHQRMKNFRRLWLSKTMINIISKEYSQLYGKSEEETHRLLTFYSRKFQRKKNVKKIRKRKWGI
ncbi:MAG: lipopolysaccharide kinase [Flavobacteriaceae bacterium]|nr:lipopolysaccharide kinase [Flavobacteriaceae bacterium]